MTPLHPCCPLPLVHVAGAPRTGGAPAHRLEGLVAPDQSLPWAFEGFNGGFSCGAWHARFGFDARHVTHLVLSRPRRGAPAPLPRRLPALPEAPGQPAPGAMAVLTPEGQILGSRGPARQIERIHRAARQALAHGGPLLVDGWRAELTRLHHGPDSVMLAQLAPYRQLVRPSFSILTRTQLQVCERAALGFTLAEIAERRGCAHETVRSHLRDAYTRLQISTRVELVWVMEERERWRTSLRGDLLQLTGPAAGYRSPKVRTRSNA